MATTTGKSGTKGGSVDPRADRPSPGQMLTLRKLAGADPRSAGAGWRALSESYTDVAATRTQTPQTVIIAPGAGMGHPGWWANDAAKIGLEGTMLPCSPEQLDPNGNPEHFSALAVMHGVLIHEAGHASHSPEKQHTSEDEAVNRCGTLLEEIRMEAQVVRNRPADARWLRCASKAIILDEISKRGGFDSPQAAFNAALLLEGRALAGSLTPADVAPVVAAIEGALGADLNGQITDLMKDAITVADDDHAGQLAMAERLAKLMPASEQDGSGDGSGEGSDEGSGEGLGDAVKDALDKAAEDAAKGAGDSDAKSEIESLADDASARNEISEAEAEAARNTMGGSGGASPERGERAPSAEEAQARTRLSTELRKVVWRDRRVVKRSSQLPPGRLRAREAVRRSAEISQGRMATAKPWKQHRRRHVEFPKLTCGVLVDTSGSMSYACKEISSSLWILANAVADNGGKVAGALFGDTAEIVVPAEKPPRFVIEIKPSGGTEHVPEGIEMLGGMLDWKNEEGPRLLVIISDGFWADSLESQGAIAEARAQGITVIQVGVDMLPPDHGADQIVSIDKQAPFDLVTVVGRAAVEELKLW